RQPTSTSSSLAPCDATVAIGIDIRLYFTPSPKRARPMPQRSAQTIVLGVTLAVAACGGGPGLSVSTPPKYGRGSSAPTYMEPSGTVTAYRLDGAAHRGPAVGTAVAYANGFLS